MRLGLGPAQHWPWLDGPTLGRLLMGCARMVVCVSQKKLGLHLCTSLLLICCIRGPRELDSDGVTFCIALLINISCYIIYSLFIEQCLVNYVVDAHVQ